MVTSLVTILLFEAKGGRGITGVEFSDEDHKKNDHRRYRI